MDINSMSGSLYTQYASIFDNSNSSELDSALRVDKKDATDEEMMEACKQFEQYFVEQMFKEMKKTVPEDSLIGNNEYYKMFEDQLTQGVAKSVTDSGQLGLAQKLYESMASQRTAISPAELETERKKAETVQTDEADASGDATTV